VQVDIALEDTPEQVAAALQTEIDAQTDLSATVSGREITVTDQDGGIVAQSATSTSAKITTSVDTFGEGPDIPTQGEEIPDVTTDASNYLFDFKDGEGNQANPSLKIVRGETYEFNLSVTGDPFRITTVDGPYDPANEYTD
jgi:phage tail sheath gpL-like